MCLQVPWSSREFWGRLSIHSSSQRAPDCLWGCCSGSPSPPVNVSQPFCITSGRGGLLAPCWGFVELGTLPSNDSYEATRRARSEPHIQFPQPPACTVTLNPSAVSQGSLGLLYLFCGAYSGQSLKTTQLRCANP